MKNKDHNHAAAALADLKGGLRVIPTIGELNRLISFARDDSGRIYIQDIKGDVAGNIYGELKGRIIPEERSPLAVRLNLQKRT